MLLHIITHLMLLTRVLNKKHHNRNIFPSIVVMPVMHADFIPGFIHWPLPICNNSIPSV